MASYSLNNLLIAPAVVFELKSKHHLLVQHCFCKFRPSVLTQDILRFFKSRLAELLNIVRKQHSRAAHEVGSLFYLKLDVRSVMTTKIIALCADFMPGNC